MGRGGKEKEKPHEDELKVHMERKKTHTHTFALDLFLTLQRIIMRSSLTLTFPVIFHSQKLDPVSFAFLPLLVSFSTLGEGRVRFGAGGEAILVLPLTSCI